MRTIILYWQHYLAALIGVAGFASAFPVYRNTAAHLPIATGFFWFTLFALITAFCYPRDATQAFAPGASLMQRWRRFYPCAPWTEWRDSLRRGGWMLLAVTCAAHLGHFIFLLSALRSRQTAAVITVIVIQQLHSVIVPIASYYVLGDTCKQWPAYFVGTLITVTGVFIYKWKGFAGAPVVFMDEVFVLTIASTICKDVGLLARAQYRRKYDVDALDAMRSTQLVTAIVGLIWVCAAGDFTVPSLTALGGLAYLGIVPTAASGILIGRAQDIIGIPATSSIGALRPLLLIPLGWLPIHALRAPNIELLGLLHYAGIIISLIGLCVVFRIAQPMPVAPSARPHGTR